MEQRRLENLRSFGLTDKYPKDQLKSILKIASHICDTPISLIDIIDEKNQRTIATFGDWEEKVIPRSKSICDRVVVDDQMLIINDVEKNKEISSRLNNADKEKIKFYAGTPLISAEGFSLGALCVIDSKPRRLSDFQKESLQTLSNEIMARLELSRKTKELHQTNSTLTKYNNFLRNTADLLCIIDSNSAQIIESNKGFSTLLGVKRTQIKGRDFFQLIKDSGFEKESLKEKVLALDEKNQSLSSGISFKSNQDTFNWFEGSFSFFNGNIYFSGKDVTEKQIARSNAEKLQRKYEKVAKATSDIIWELDPVSRAINFNLDFFELLGYSKQEINSTSDWWRSIVHPEDVEILSTEFEHFLTSDKTYWEGKYRVRTSDDKYIHVFDNAYAERDKNGIVTEVIGAVTDISALIKAEALQRQLISRLRMAGALAKLGYWEIDLSNNDIYFSKGLYNILGVSEIESPSIDDLISQGDVINQKKLKNFIKDLRSNQGNNEFEYELITRNGVSKYLLNKGELVTGADHEPDRIVITTQDITKRRNHELDLENTLKEKETLLAEVHHRVKNNLAVVSGLLELESMYTDDMKQQAFINKSLVRIKSMALLYETLYKSKDYKVINFKNFLTDVIDNVYTTSLFENNEIQFNFDLPEIELNINQAVPCALILNELVTNSIKHAFNEHINGVINITLSYEEDEFVSMKVKDNGSGVTDIDEFHSSDKFGKTLIDVLCSQLEAETHSVSKDGFEFNLKFKKKDSKGSASNLS
jgi:PAS domain S-box-containing protein